MNHQSVPFPEEYDRRKLNALYRQIPMKDTTSRMLRKYFNAMANLYGIIPLEKAWEIVHSQCPRLVTEADFYAFAEIARHECEDYYILGADEIYTEEDPVEPSQREIIHIELFGLHEDAYVEIWENQQGKPYYIPEKQELLRYADTFYYESTLETEKMAEFCTKKLKMDEQDVEFVLTTMNSSNRFLDPDIKKCLESLELFGVSFSSDEQFNTFIQLYEDMHNATRKQCNRGFTPHELYEMAPPEERVPRSLTFGPNIRKAIADGSINADEMRAQIFSVELPSEEMRLDMLRQIDGIAAAKPKKVARNAPCPCGSGRKYKNCCGRN